MERHDKRLTEHFCLDGKPITAMLIVYNPVFTMIPAKMD